MKTLIWKYRFTRKLQRLLHLSFSVAWDHAGAWVESNYGDLDMCPIDCAEAEADAWRGCI